MHIYIQLSSFNNNKHSLGQVGTENTSSRATGSALTFDNSAASEQAVRSKSPQDCLGPSTSIMVTYSTNTMQETAFMEKGIKVDWSCQHKDVFQLLICGTRTKICYHCNQADHQFPFCFLKLMSYILLDKNMQDETLLLQMNMVGPKSHIRGKTFAITSMETQVVLDHLVHLRIYVKGVRGLVMG